MRFQLNFKSPQPVDLQIVDQVKSAAASGAVQPGEPLLSIRPLAEELPRLLRFRFLHCAKRRLRPS
jgi:DNA-binding transcriptional regulator YhcF (GntR family)